MDIDTVSRRRILVGAAGATVTLLVERSAAAAPRGRRQARRVATAFTNPPTRTVRVVRAADQLDITLELFDVTLSANQLTVAGAQPSVRITFGSQHTVERQFVAPTPSVPTTPIGHIAAGDSVVVTPVTGTTSFSLTQILALAESALTVQTAAATPDGGATALELPTGLAISPSAGSTLTASRTPFTVGDTTEVWLAQFRGVGSAPVQGVAVANLAAGDLVVRIPAVADRENIRDNTTGGDPDDAPFSAKRLWLSSSGAFARIEGDWPNGVLTRWEQRIATGRDLHVEVTSVGYLAPFGHRAAITQIAERQFIADTGGGQTSIVRLQRFLTLIEPEVVYLDGTTPRPYQLHDGRGLPFTRVTAAVDETLAISLATVNDLSSNPITSVSDVKVNGTNTDVMVDYRAVDRDGHIVKFSLPATFIGDDVAYSVSGGAAPAKFVAVFNSAARNARRDVDLRGQELAFADPTAPGTNATTKPTYFLRFELQGSDGATLNQLKTARQPAFNPAVAKAEVTDALVGSTSGSPDDAFEVTLHPRWLSEGNTPDNFDLSFLKLKDPKSGVLGGAGQPVTSVAAVELVAEVFNQSSGIGPDLDLPTDGWDPDAALGAGSKLLGSLLLNELMAIIPSNVAVPGVDIPGTDITIAGDTITIVFSFKPKLTSKPVLGFIARPATQCCVVVTTVASLSGAEPTVVTTQMTVSDFTMVFPPGGIVGIVEVDFDELAVTAPSNGSLTVDPQMSGWRLGDDLSFLQPIFDFLESLGSLQVGITDDFLQLGASLNLPSLNLGMVAIRNFHLDFGLDLPLDGQPLALHAGAGSADSPIEAKVSIYGGSFFVTLDLEFHQSQVDWRVEAGVSAFMEVSFDAIVVSAAIRLRISLSFIFNKTAHGNSTKFIGSVSLEGEIGVLGLVEVSVAIVATVTYNSATEKAVAKCEVHWAVDTPFGGPDGVIKLGETEFVLGDGNTSGPGRATHVPAVGPPPTASFGNLYSSNDWSDYSGAFA